MRTIPRFISNPTMTARSVFLEALRSSDGRSYFDAVKIESNDGGKMWWANQASTGRGIKLFTSKGAAEAYVRKSRDQAVDAWYEETHR
jgi:hypothetical protein